MRKRLPPVSPKLQLVGADAEPSPNSSAPKRPHLSAKRTHGRLGARGQSRGASLQERGATLLIGLANRTVDVADTATDLLDIARTESGALACGLFRAVQDTGLLVPMGRPAFSKANGAESRLSVLMARAADQAASMLALNGALTPTGSAYRRRTTAQGGYVVWATVIVGPPHTDASADDNEIGPGQQVERGGTLFHPQVLGAWVTVTRAPARSSAANMRGAKPTGELEERFETDPPADVPPGTSPQHLAAASRRLHPLFQLLLQQVVLREGAATAQRQTEKRMREVAAIHDIGAAIDQIDIQDLFDLIVRKAADVMDAQACSLMIVNDATDQLGIAASCGLPDDVVENTRILVGQGIAGRVAQTGEALMVQSDARLDPRFKGARGIGLPGIASSITMPMLNEHQKARGVLCIRRRTPAPVFTEDDKRLFNIFATQASLAIKNARLYRDLRSRVQELSTLAALTETISSTLDLDFVLNQVADSLIQLVEFDRCLLYLKDDTDGRDEERFTVRVARGFDKSVAQLPATDQLIREVTSRLIPILMEDGDRSLPLAVEYAAAMGLKAFFAQPVIVRGNAIGVLVVSNDVTRRPIAYSNLDLLSTFLQHAGIAIDNARLYAQMERRVRELHTLYTMSRSLTTTYGLSRACATVAGVATDLVHADSVLLMLFNDRLDTLRVREEQGLPEALSSQLRLLPDSTDVRAEARALREPVQHGPTERRAKNGASEAFTTLFGARWQDLMTALAREYPSLLLVPLVTEDTAVGFLLLGRRQAAAYGSEETKLVSIISSQAGALLRGAALYEQTVEQRVLELSALYELSKKVRTARSLNGALDAILDIVSSVIWCDVAEIYTVNRQEQTITRQVSRGEATAASVMPLDSRTIPTWVIYERKALLITDVTSDIRFRDLVPADAPGKSLMAIPVFLGDEVLAVLQVQAAVSGLYSEDNVKMLSLIAAQAAALFRDMESLRELTTYTDNILRSIAAGVVALDAQGRIVTVNQAAERILRVRFAELNGRPFDALLERLQGDADDIDDIRKMVAHAAETRQQVQRHRLRVFVEDAHNHVEPAIVNGSAAQLLSERGEYLGVVLVFEDMTKETEMEHELSRISRLAEIGQLAAGIAHELRNPLASIKGAAQVLLGDLTPELVDRHGEFLDIIVREVDGLSAVTSEFLEFSRPATPVIAPVALNSLLRQRADFMRAEIEPLGVAIELDLDQNLPDVEADASQLERVFLNIILNAVQAMPTGGMLTIKTRMKAMAAKDDPKDAQVEIVFADNGLGIPTGRLEKIFTPFFTTKTKGTGLGLSIVQKIVDSHGGHIHVDSEADDGTTFMLTLPVSSPFTQRFKLESMPGTEIAEQRLHAALRRPISGWLNGTGGQAADLADATRPVTEPT